MIKYLFFITFIIIFVNEPAISKPSAMVYSHQGYPYKNLINRSDSIKIIYTENGAWLNCYVDISRSDHRWTSQPQKVALTEFQQKPLASCLNRDLTKQILAETFGG